MRALECFLAVAEELHFSRAAKKLNLSQPPLSKHIRELESELNVQLFVRDRRKVILTEAGKVYRERITSIFKQLADAQRAALQAQEGKTGELRIGFLSALFYDFVPSLLLRYRQRFPGVQVTLQEMVPAEQMEGMRTGKLDVAFPGITPQWFLSGFSARVLRRDKWFLAFHAKHPLAKRQRLTLRDLRDEPFVLVDPFFSPAFHNAIVELCRDAGFYPHVVQTSSRAQSLLSLVAAGIGVSVFPDTVTRLPSAGLVFRPMGNNTPRYEHAVVWNPHNNSPVLAGFLRELGELSGSGKKNTVM